MKEPETGKIYCLIRRAEIEGRNVKVCRRVRVLRTEGEQVLLDHGDGSSRMMKKEKFWKMVQEE